MKKQFISKLLVLAMILAMVPATFLAVSAADVDSGVDTTCPDDTCPDDTCPDDTCPGGSTNTPADTTPVAPAPIETTVDATDVEVKDDELVIEAEVVNGTANVVLTDKAVEALTEQVEGDELVLKVEAEGATKVNVSISGKALAAMGEKTSAALTIQSPIVTITIPNEALATVFGDVGNVRISAQASGYSIGFTIQAGGKALKNIKGLQVTF